MRVFDKNIWFLFRVLENEERHTMAKNNLEVEEYITIGW